VQGDVDRAEFTRRFRHFTRRRAAELMAASAILSGLIGPGIIVAASVCICPARRSTSAREPHNEARPKKHMSDPGKPRSIHAAKRAGASRNAGHAA